MNYVCPKVGLISAFCLITIFVATSTLETNLCNQIDFCTCKGDNYTVNLTSLASLGSPKFSISVPELNQTIHYKPCNPFQLGKETSDGSCGQTGGVAVCVESNDTEFKSWGTQLSTRIAFNTSRSLYQITYTDNNRVVKVLLNCISDNYSNLTMDNYTQENQILYLTLSSPYACDGGVAPAQTTIEPPTTIAPNITTEAPATSSETPTPPPPRGLSAGSILVICFFVFAAVYLIGGMFYRACYLGAQGLEMIPNYEFWSDFPVLVKDGFLYLFSCCQREPRYDSI